MDDALARQEYPGMLASLPPVQAASVLGDRLKRIHKTNTEVADWLEERKRVEDLYVQGLTKLVRRQPPDSSSELGIFTGPWTKIVGSVETIAQSHSTFASRLEADVISSLRDFSQKNREMAGMPTIQGNLEAMVKELDAAQKSSDKLAKKGGKANSSKVDTASQKLDTARQEWETQAPFIFEKLQAVDESRLNHMRDVLTQLLTHEADQVERCRVTAEAALGSMLEVDTAVEIKNFAANQTKGKPKIERSAAQRTISNSGSTGGVPSTPSVPAMRPSADDQTSMTSSRNDVNEKESKGGLKRLGTMLNRRRQSVVGSSGGFARAPSPSKGYAAFSRSTASREGRPSPSPRASSNNLRGSNPDNRLSSLAETSPTAPETPSRVRGDTNGTSDNVLIADLIAGGSSPSAVNGTSKPLPDLSDVQPPPGPPPNQLNNSFNSPPKLDSEGFSIPAPRNDPIAQAQAEAAETAEQQAFKLDIKNETIREDDEASQAALSNVANTLRTSSIAGPSRKQGTVRGRRDVRNTMYIPPPDSPDMRIPESGIPPSPGLPTSVVGGNRAAALAALSSGSVAASDAGSIRSSRSTTAAKHPELHGRGLNSSIHETVSAYFENGIVQSASVVGELALVHGYDELNPIASSGTNTIRLENFSTLEAIVPNQAFISPLSAEKPGEYNIDLSQLAKTSVAFHYKLHVDQSNLAEHVPVLLKPAWRPQEDKLGVVVEYGLNPAYSSIPITLHNFVLLATYEGGRAAGCQTKPTGTHLKDKSLIYWRIGDVTLDASMQKVIARLTGAEGANLAAGSIEARWEYQSTTKPKLGSGLGVSRLDASKKEEVNPFADDSITSSSNATAGSWIEVPGVRKVVSGKYEARQVAV